ncbi:MAG: cell division ATP-binding protein FtsE [Deltaproteobacteria bacterium]|nr:cell division ATP-binding protein FtsE [Deltaproteobacteria bacterium]
MGVVLDPEKSRGSGKFHPRGDYPVRMFHVSKSYSPGTWALQDVSLEVGRGQFLFVTGQSGAGKTTLLELLFAAERPNEGQILVLGRNIARLRGGAIPALRRRVGVVFQDFKLLPNRTVEENVRFTLDVLGTPRREARSRVFNTLRQVGLQHRRYDQPKALSGGEQQRVAIARALVGDPEILLADEPTGNLDPELSVEIIELMIAAARRGTTVIVATHDISLVQRYGMRNIRLEGGRLLEESQEGTPS